MFDYPMTPKAAILHARRLAKGRSAGSRHVTDHAIKKHIDALYDVYLTCRNDRLAQQAHVEIDILEDLIVSDTGR